MTQLVAYDQVGLEPQDIRPTLFIGPELEIKDMAKFIRKVAYLSGLLVRFKSTATSEVLRVDPSVLCNDVSITALRNVAKLIMDKQKYTSRFVCITTEENNYCGGRFTEVNLSHSDWMTNSF